MQWNGNFKGKEYYYHMHVAPQFASTMQKIAWALTCSFLWSYCSNLNCFKHKILTNFLGLDFPFTHLDHGPWCILLLSISSRISSFDMKRGLWNHTFKNSMPYVIVHSWHQQFDYSYIMVYTFFHFQLQMVLDTNLKFH